MKANAPEKLYVSDYDSEVRYNWHPERLAAKDVEYIRADAFIEKALKWYCLDCECNDNCKDTKCFFYREYERYLKGEANVLPPKFSYRILNEDGSTSDNWRYRHFISKMQDAFIEKAVKWLEKYADNYTWYNEFEGESGMIEDFIRNFRKAMKL